MSLGELDQVAFGTVVTKPVRNHTVLESNPVSGVEGHRTVTPVTVAI